MKHEESTGSSFLQALGPGLIFAAAAVGVSHLVQSTRAGAGWGLAMLGFVILANALKYPAFRFGPHYAAATGQSLLEGYRRQGRWALVLYAAVTLATMFTVQAAVTLVCAGLVKAALGALGWASVSLVAVAAALLLMCAALLAVGQYRWLDRITKVLVALLTLCTLVATVMILPQVSFSGGLWPASFDAKTVMFTAALVGWMPSAVDVAVWSSLWTLARNEDSGHRASLPEAMLDFHIGYLGTALLAVCFLLLGAGVMHASGEAFDDRPIGFALQIIGLYEQTLGAWAGPVVTIAAIAVMFSTTLTVLDGFPRALATLVRRFRGPERADLPPQDEPGWRTAYWASLLALASGALLVIAALATSLPAMVDMATTLSFLTAPALAILNHRAVHSQEVPPEGRPAPWLQAFSLVGIAALSLFALYYLYLLATTG